MNDDEVLARLTRILRDFLLDDGIQLTMDTHRPDVPGWDSFAYINFIVAVEQEFGVNFGVADVESFDTVGEIVQRLQQITARNS